MAKSRQNSALGIFIRIKGDYPNQLKKVRILMVQSFENQFIFFKSFINDQYDDDHHLQDDSSILKSVLNKILVN
jgi:hypothetical protein